MTDDKDLYDRLVYNQNTTGATLSSFDAYLLMRGLKTLALCMECLTKNTQKVVGFYVNQGWYEKFTILEKVG